MKMWAYKPRYGKLVVRHTKRALREHHNSGGAEFRVTVVRTKEKK